MVLLVRTMCLVGFISTFPVMTFPVQAQATSEPTRETNTAYLYEHPRQRYSIGIPVNVVLQDRGSKRGIVLNSRKGFQITVQTNPTNPTLDLFAMLSRLESRYLGDGKPWSRKFEQGETRVAGLNAVEALYEGAGVRVRVIIVRGARLDYVFIYLASPLNFQKLASDFEWLMASFKPAPGDLANPREPAANTKVFRTFLAPAMGFSLNYPVDWVVERQGDHLVVVSGKPGTPAYFATVSLQNIKGANKRAEPENSVTVALKDLKNQIMQADNNARFSNEGPYIHETPNQRLPGAQFTVTYEQNNITYRQWTIVLSRPNDDIIHIWSYAAPENLYANFGSIAGSVLQSWDIIPAP